MKNLIFFLIALYAVEFNTLQCQDSTYCIHAIVVDENSEPIPFVNLVVTVDGKPVTGTSTDFDGKGSICNLDTGIYELRAMSLGFGERRISKIILNGVSDELLDTIMLATAAEMLDVVEVVAYDKPIFQKGSSRQETMSVKNLRQITSNTPQLMRARNPAELAATAGGTYSSDNGMTHIRGSRSDANYYFIDGIKIRGSSAIPRSAIEQITVVKGGIPARYENAEFASVIDAPIDHPGVGIFSKGVFKKEHKHDYKPAERHVYDKLLENYEYYAENAFKSSASEELSTFSIDVDQGSYTNSRRIINSGYLPPMSSVRMEEFINYFPYERIDHDDEHPFIVDSELGDCPWNEKHQLLKVTLQADGMDYAEASASNLVFLIDVSGSMSSTNKLALIKRAFVLLAKQLRKEDRVSIVVYAGSTGVVLNGARGDQPNEIISAIDQLHAGGSTAGGAGIRKAYSIAEKHFIKGGNNRVILATDGDFNVGVTSDSELVKLIEKKRESGVFFSTIGCGSGNYHDAKLEQLADHGNGSYAYIDTYKEARKVFLKNLTGTLFTVAKDVKLQIEFNPSKVSSYRLLGYENRVLADEDFDNDLKDAGELGAGQMVTAFYELVPPGVYEDSARIIDKRYKETTLTALSDSDELLNLKIRYKLPESSESILIERPVTLGVSDSSQLSESFQFGSAVVEVALILRDSKFKAESNLLSAIERASRSKKFDPEGYRQEFATLSEMCAEMYASMD